MCKGNFFLIKRTTAVTPIKKRTFLHRGIDMVLWRRVPVSCVPVRVSPWTSSPCLICYIWYLIFSNKHDLLIPYSSEKNCLFCCKRISSKTIFTTKWRRCIEFWIAWTFLKKIKFFWECTVCTVQCSAEIWCRSEQIQASSNMFD